MKVCVIGSGSKGNMTYIEAGKSKILIDAGISLVSAKSRCPNINFNEVTDVLITHEHGDHIKFLGSVIKKTNANLYISQKSFKQLKPEIKDSFVGRKIGFLDSECRYRIGEFDVLTLSLVHDTVNTFGFILIHEDENKVIKKFGYVTDTGIFPSRYKNLLSDLDVLVIEANHNVEMLQNSNRDYNLINRILSPNGHISNKACYELLREVLTIKNKYVILAHISEDCNSEQRINEDIIDRLYNYKGKIIIASQNEAIELIEV